MKLKHITRAEIENLCRIADLAKHYPTNRSKQPPILPSILECPDMVTLDRAMTAGMPPARIALVRHIQNLSPEAMTELAVLCWLGRGCHARLAPPACGTDLQQHATLLPGRQAAPLRIPAGWLQQNQPLLNMRYHQRDDRNYDKPA